MNVDSNLRIEIISSLLGQTIKPYDKKTNRAAEDILSVDDFHLHNLTGKRKAYTKKPIIKEEDFFDPQYDCDFTNLSDSAGCTRGDELYQRPKGWYRMALKVKGKYPDGDSWLGPKGWRSHSVPGEWPVSYHGTSLDGAKGIIKSHYSAGNGDMYGRGIYSTPDIHVAEREEYAKTFTSKTTGKRYKVILQNRINPKIREICQRFDYWLVPVHKGASATEERKTVENSIRPYGILIKELNDSCDSDDSHNDGDDSDDGDEVDGDCSSQTDYSESYSKYDDGSVSNSGNEDDDDDDDTSDDDIVVDDGNGYDHGNESRSWDGHDDDDNESDDDSTIHNSSDDNGGDDDDGHYDDGNVDDESEDVGSGNDDDDDGHYDDGNVDDESEDVGSGDDDDDDGHYDDGNVDDESEDVGSGDDDYDDEGSYDGGEYDDDNGDDDDVYSSQCGSEDDDDDWS